MLRRLALIALALPLLGVGATPLAASPEPPGLGCDDARAAMALQADRLLRATPALRALLLGEIHTSEADHAWQLATLEAVRLRRPRLVLALEMVPAPRQPVLDRYSAGQLDDAAFLRQVGWEAVWGHDPALYLPLLHWARQWGVPLLALNAEPALVRRLRRDGWQAIPVSQRQGIGRPAAASPSYLRRLEASWQAHQALSAVEGTAGSPASGDSAALERSALERFIASQLLRDRAMAEAIAAAQRRDPDRLVVALIGRGHLEPGEGVPLQLADLGLSPVLSVSRVALPEGCGAAPRGARLGAYLESVDGAVWVRRVAAGSAAEAAGILPGDRILAVDGVAVDHAGQVIRAVRLHADAAPLTLTLERQGRRLQIRLTLPPRSDVQRAARDNGSAERLASFPQVRSPS